MLTQTAPGAATIGTGPNCVCVCESLFCLAVSSLQDVLQDCIQACLLPASSEAFNATADQSSLPDTIYLD